jgi:hypothetical protein
MVHIIIKNLALVAVFIFTVSPFGSSQQLYDDGSLAARGEGLYGNLDARNFHANLDARDLYDEFDARDLFDELGARDFYDGSEALYVRSYIDDKINLALRSYDVALQELYTRASEAEIASQIATWTKRYNDAKALLRPAVQRERDAKKALDKDKNNKTLQTAYRKAGNEVHTIRGSMEGAEESLDHWKAQKPSPGPSRSSSPSKGSHK